MENELFLEIRKQFEIHIEIFLSMNFTIFTKVLDDFKISFCRFLNIIKFTQKGVKSEKKKKKSYSWKIVQDYLLRMNYAVYDFALKTNGFKFPQMFFSRVKRETVLRGEYSKLFSTL